MNNSYKQRSVSAQLTKTGPSFRGKGRFDDDDDEEEEEVEGRPSDDLMDTSTERTTLLSSSRRRHPRATMSGGVFGSRLSSPLLALSI